MEKVTFTRAVVVAQGDGKGPTFEAGKTYWLRPDSAQHWRNEDAAVDAAPSAKAENEPPPPPSTTLPENVRIVPRARGSRFDVVTVDGYRFNPKPLSADAADTLRRQVLDGTVKRPPPPPIYADGQPMTFIQHVDGDKKTIYVAAPWPKIAAIDSHALEMAIEEKIAAVSGDELTIIVGNGHAIYALGNADDHGRFAATLVSGEFEPVPPPPAPAPTPSPAPVVEAETNPT